MSEITLSASVRSNLLSLQSTANLLGETQEKLATGLKVSSALDDPTAFFTASSLNQRANDLSRLQDFVGNAVQTLKAADEGITALTKLTESAEATARQALQSASTAATHTGTVDLSGVSDLTSLAGVANGDTFTVQVGSAGAQTITINTGDDVDQIASEINAAVANASASVTSDGFLKIEATNGESLTLADGTNTPLDDLGLTATAETGSLNAERSGLATQFDDLRSQISQLVSDAGFNGVNLLNGDSLTVNFNEDSSSTLNVAGVTFDSAGLGISATVDNLQADTDINAALNELKAATDTLRSQASKFGSNLSVVETRQDFTKALVNVLETGAANLTLADTNEEGANLLALQTRQQLSSVSLSLASQADQNVLRLF